MGFSTTGDLDTGRAIHTATELSNDLVLIITGGIGSSGVLDSAELYNPASGAFMPVCGNMGTQRHNHTAMLLGNGNLLVCGGDGSGTDPVSIASVELYNSSAGTFSSAGGMGTGRTNHIVSLFSNGRILVCGGLGGIGFLTSAELYWPELQAGFSIEFYKAT